MLAALRILCLVGCVSAGLWVGHAFYSAVTERDTLRGMVASQAAVIEQTQRERASLERALMERQAAVQQARTQYDTAVSRIEEALRHDEVSRAWGDELVPDALGGVF